MKNSVIAIIVTYNRKILLEECIDNVISTNVKNLAILIVDNASTDGTYEMICKKFDKKVKYVNTGHNLGGAGGFNFGIKYALETGNYDYIWIMDDDTIVHKDSLDKLLKKAKELNNDFSFLSSVVLWKDNTLCNMNIQSVGKNSIENYKSISQFSIVCIDSASFVSCFVNSNAIKNVGLPIKDFFIYGDDLEYTKRLSTYKSGYLVPESIVTHKMSSNDGINIIDADKNRISRYFYNYRNLLYIYKKYDIRQYRIYKLKCYYLILKCIFKSKSHRFKRVLIIIRALFLHKKFNPKIQFIGERL